MEPNIDFNRIDCSLTHDLCEELQVTGVPAIMFLPAENVAYNNTYPEVPTADGIIRFINQHIGTHRIVDGGLDDAYGRDPELDLLAEEFSTVRMNWVVDHRRMRSAVKRLCVKSRRNASSI